MGKHGQDLDAKSLTICSGLDLVNINYLHIVCESAEQAKVSFSLFSLGCLFWIMDTYKQT